jgi:FkbM family methyltransferase
MISYAQNAEDVVLARALSKSEGFYVDVGAGDPDNASVTKHFYDLGWNGINIEPRADAFSRLEQRRPRDVNLQVAAGDSDRHVTLYLVDGDLDLSTTDPTDLAILKGRGHRFTATEVPMTTLDSVLEAHDVTTLDFLKIDVEGGEAAVLRGIDLSRWRPRVVVVEGVQPWSHERQDGEWRELVEDHGYAEACFDGLNMFFARPEDESIFSALVPASVLDDYEPASVVALREELEHLRRYVGHVEGELKTNREFLLEVEKYVQSLEATMEANAGTAPVGELQQARSKLSRERSRRPPRAARLAIIGTPASGGSFVRRVLADSLDAIEMSVVHPSEIDWDYLPSQCVFQLHWGRSRYLEKILGQHGVAVISPARHPIEVLRSLFALDPRDPRRAGWDASTGGDHLTFEEWAATETARFLLSLTPQWWASPAVRRVRFEEVQDDPISSIQLLLEGCEISTRADLVKVVESNAIYLQPPAEHTSTDAHLDSIHEIYSDVIDNLGYGERGTWRPSTAESGSKAGAGDSRL